MRERSWVQVPGVLVFVIAAMLLTSIGGLGIVASPITLPLMYAAVTLHPTRAFRIAGVIIGGLTGLELGWGVGVLAFDDNGSAALALSVIAATVSVVLFATAGNAASRAVAAQRG